MVMITRKRGRKAICPYCKSKRTHNKGIRRTSTLGERPLRFCNDCRRKFTLNRPITPVEPEPIAQDLNTAAPLESQINM